MTKKIIFFILKKLRCWRILRMLAYHWILEIEYLETLRKLTKNSTYAKKLQNKIFIIDRLIGEIMYVTYHASLKEGIANKLQIAHDKFWKYDNDTYDFSQIETTIWRIPYYYELLFNRDYLSINRIRDLIKHKTKITIRNTNTVYDLKNFILAIPFSCLSICKPKFHVVSTMDNKLYIFKRYTFLFTIIKNIDKVYGYKLVFNFYLKKNYYEE